MIITEKSPFLIFCSFTLVYLLKLPFCSFTHCFAQLLLVAQFEDKSLPPQEKEITAVTMAASSVVVVTCSSCIWFPPVVAAAASRPFMNGFPDKRGTVVHGFIPFPPHCLFSFLRRTDKFAWWYVVIDNIFVKWRLKTSQGCRVDCRWCCDVLASCYFSFCSITQPFAWRNP